MVFSDLYGNLQGYFYELFFQIYNFVYQIEFWCYDEFGIQSPQEYISFFVILGMLAVFLILLAFTIVIMYKAVKFFISIFV